MDEVRLTAIDERLADLAAEAAALREERARLVAMAEVPPVLAAFDAETTRQEARLGSLLMKRHALAVELDHRSTRAELAQQALQRAEAAERERWHRLREASRGKPRPPLTTIR